MIQTVRFETRQDILPMLSCGAWERKLRELSSRSLEYCEDFPQIARRFEAWWNHECLDRPIFIASANSNPARPINRRLDLLNQPEAWLKAKLEDLRQTHRVGDSLPHVRVDFGPVLLGGLLGGKIEFGADTTWTHSFINDEWSNAPDWRLHEDNSLWRLLRKLTNLVSREAVGRFLLCTPDLGGSADVLLNLRGPQALCMDALEQPERIREVIDSIYPVWRRVLSDLYQTTLENGAGLIHWLQLWSQRPYMIPACDFNFMIGPEEFQKICLPDIVRQAGTVGRAVFHLDGPGAARHIDSLLEVPEIQAIQFTPGEGTPSTLRWVEMFRKIQNHGRSLVVICPSCEVVELCKSLRPEGLAILMGDSLAPDELDRLFAQFCRS